MDHENNSWCSAQVPLNQWCSERPRKGGNEGKTGMKEPHNHEYQTDQKFRGSTITRVIVRSKGRRASREGRTFLYRMSCLPVSGTRGGLAAGCRWGLAEGGGRRGLPNGVCGTGATGPFWAGASLRHSRVSPALGHGFNSVSVFSGGRHCTIWVCSLAKGECFVCLSMSCPLSYCLGIPACSTPHYILRHPRAGDAPRRNAPSSPVELSRILQHPQLCPHLHPRLHPHKPTS